VAPSVDISELQRTVGQYAGRHANLFIAAGPFTALALVRCFITKNKLVSGALTAGGVVLAMQGIAGPMLKLMHDQFGYLIGLLGSVRS
jgi:hypothetical protein